MEVFCFPSFGEENEGRREGEVCGSPRFLWGPHLAPLFLRKWAWWTLGSGSRGVSGAVSPQWIPLWFPLSRLHYSSREEEAGQLSQTPFGRSPQAPDKWLCATGAGKKEAMAGVAVIMGAREDRRGFGLAWTGTGIICGPGMRVFRRGRGEENCLKGKKGRGHLEKFGILLKTREEWMENIREEDRVAWRTCLFPFIVLL